MTQIFLGYPPEHIKNWIIEHSQANPPMGNATWVPAVYTDNWVFSDGKSYDIQYTTYDPGDPNNPGGYTGWFCIDNSSYYFADIIGQPDIPQHATTLTFHDPTNWETIVSASRYFTPGHWEDADGNWINGSWSDWSNSNLIEWSKPNYTYIDEDKWIYRPDPDSNVLNVYPSEYDQNANLCQHITAFELIATRTWTNTKPAPENQ